MKEILSIIEYTFSYLFGLSIGIWFGYYLFKAKQKFNKSNINHIKHIKASLNGKKDKAAK